MAQVTLAQLKSQQISLGVSLERYTSSIEWYIPKKNVNIHSSISRDDKIRIQTTSLKYRFSLLSINSFVDALSAQTSPQIIL